MHSIEEAPEDVKELDHYLTILSDLVNKIGQQAEHHGDIESTILAAVQQTFKRISHLQEMVEELRPLLGSGNKLKRKWTALKAVRKQEILQKFRGYLEETKSTLILVQQELEKYARFLQLDFSLK